MTRRRAARTTIVPNLPAPIPFVPDARIKSPKVRGFLAAYAVSGSVSQAAHLSGESRYAHYERMKADKVYATEVEHARLHAGERLELVARLRAENGSDVLVIFLLKGIFPDKYRERFGHEHAGKDGGPIEHVTHISFHKDMDPPASADHLPKLKPAPAPKKLKA